MSYISQQFVQTIQKRPTLIPIRIFHRCSKGLLHSQKRDPFSVLDLESCASFEQVKKRYLLLVKKLHPDVLETTTDEYIKKERSRSFVELQEAYEVLQKLYASGQFRKDKVHYSTQFTEKEYASRRKPFSKAPPSPRCLRAGNNGELPCYIICDGCRIQNKDCLPLKKSQQAFMQCQKEIVKNINRDQLHFHLWRGKVSLSHVKLKTSLWNSLVSPLGFVLQQGMVDSLELSLFQSQTSITLKGLHLKFQQAPLQDQKSSWSETIYNESVFIFSGLEWNKTLSLWKTELGSFLAALVSLTVEDIRVELEYSHCGHYNQLRLFIDKLQILEREADSIPLEHSAEVDIDLGLEVSKLVLLQQFELYHLQLEHNISNIICSLASCRLELDAMIQVQEFSMSCSIVCSSPLQFYLDWNVIESLWNLLEACQYYQRAMDKCQAKHFILYAEKDTMERSSAMVAKWKWITHFMILYYVRPMRKYYRIFRACCFRWLRLNILQDEVEYYRLSSSQIFFLQRMERRYPKQCMSYLRHLRELAVSNEQDCRRVFSLLDEEYLKGLFSLSCFFRSSSWHPLMSKPTLAMICRLEEGVDVHFKDKILELDLHLSNCYLEWLSNEREQKWIANSRSVCLSVFLDHSFSSPRKGQSVWNLIDSSDTFSSWIQLEYRLEHQEPFYGYFMLELCGIRVRLNPAVFRYIRHLMMNNSSSTHERKEESKEDSVIFLIRKMKRMDPFNQLIWNALSCYQPRSSLDWFMERGAILIQFRCWDIICMSSYKGDSMEALSMSWNTLELQRLGFSIHEEENLSSFGGIQSTVDALCIVHLWESHGNSESQSMSRTLVRFDCPIELIWSRDEKENLETFQCVIDQWQVSMVSEDWLLLWHCLQQDYEIFYLPLDIIEPDHLPCFTLEWKQGNIDYQSKMNQFNSCTFSISFLLMKLDDHRLVSLQSSNELYNSSLTFQFTDQGQYSAMLSLQSIYVDPFPFLKWMKCMSPSSLTHSWKKDKKSNRQVEWIYSQVMIEKLDIAYSYPTCIPFHLLLERIRFTWDKNIIQEEREGNMLVMNEMPWKCIVFSVRLYSTLNEYTTLLDMPPFTISMRKEDDHFKMYCAFSPIHIQITLEDVDSLMNGSLYALQTVSGWMENTIPSESVQSEKQTFNLLSWRIDIEEFHFQWICWNCEFMISFQRASGGYDTSSLTEETYLLSNDASKERFWFQLPNLNVQAKNASSIWFSFQSQSIVYNLCKSPFDWLEIAELKMSLDTCCFAVLTSLVLWEQYWQSQFNSFHHHHDSNANISTRVFWYRLVLHHVSVSLTSCQLEESSITNDWEIHHWIMEYREQVECMIYFQYIVSTIGKGPNIWQYQGKPLILSIFPDWNPPDYTHHPFHMNVRAIQLSYDRQSSHWNVSIPLNTIQLQWNFPMLQLCLEFQKSLTSMMDGLSLSKKDSEVSRKGYKDSLWTIHCRVSTFRCCVLECCSLPHLQPLIGLQGTLKHIELEVSSSLPHLAITLSTSQYKFGLESIRMDNQGTHDSSFMDGGGGGGGGSSTDFSRNTSLVSDYSDNRWSSLVGHVSKKHHSLLKGDEMWVNAQPNSQSFSIRIHKCAIQFSAERYSCLDRCLKSWLPFSNSASQPFAIPHMQLTVVQAKCIWMDQDQWEGLPLGRVTLSFKLQCNPLGGRVDVSGLVEIYNMIHMALEPFIEEWSACLYIFLKQKLSHGLALIDASNRSPPPLSLSHFDILLSSSRILQVNLNPPIVATLYRLYYQLEERCESVIGSRSLFSVSNRTGETIELYRTKNVLIQQIKDGQIVQLVDQLLLQGHFYLYSPFLSSSTRIELAFDGTQCCIPITSSGQDFYLIVEKQISELNTLLEIRSNYFIQNHCDTSLWLYFFDGHEIQSLSIESGKKRSIPLYYLWNGRHIRVSLCLDEMTDGCLETSPLFMDWLQSCFQPNHLSELNCCCSVVKDGFVHCFAQSRMEWSHPNVVLHVMPLLCVKNYLGVDIYVMDDSLSSHWNLLPYTGLCMLYSLNRQRCVIRSIQTDEQYTIEWGENQHKRKYSSRCIGNTNRRCISYTFLSSSTTFAWKEIILHPDIIVSSPCLPIKEQNTLIYWQWMKPSSTIWLWDEHVVGDDSLSNECFVLCNSLHLTFGTAEEVSKLEFRLIWKDSDENVYYSTTQRCRKGNHVIHWLPIASQHSPSKDNYWQTSTMTQFYFDNSIVVVVSYQKWMEQDIVIPHATIVPKYRLENQLSSTCQLKWRDKSYILIQGSEMMLSEAMVESSDFVHLRVVTNQSSMDDEGGNVAHLRFSQIREMTSKGLNAIFPMNNGSPFFVQIQRYEDYPSERFKLTVVDCPPTTIRVVNLSTLLFRVCIGKYDSFHRQYLLGNGQCISLQPSLFMDKDCIIYFYIIQNGKSHLIYRWKDIRQSYSGPVYRKGWIFYFIPRGPYWDVIIMQQRIDRWKRTWIHNTSFNPSWMHSRATLDMAGIGISLYAMNNDEIVYTCFKRIRFHCNWTQYGYFWLSFALQDIHVDNQVTTVGRNYAVCMERANISNKTCAMVQGRLGIWLKKFACIKLSHLLMDGNDNILDELECHLQPFAFRLDSDILESFIWWWIKTQEWTKTHSTPSHHPSSKTLTFVEDFHVSNIACQLSFQFGRNGVVGLLHLPWYSYSSLAQWERWIALFGLSIGNIEDAPLLIRPITLHNTDGSSLMHQMGLFYKRDLLWSIYALMGSLNWIGNPNKCWKRMQLAFEQLVMNCLNDWKLKGLPMLLLRQLLMLNYRILDSWIEASLGMLQGNVNWLSSTLAYLPLSNNFYLKILHTSLDWSHRLLMGIMDCLEYLQSWLSRWDNEEQKGGWSERWRPIRSNMECQPLRAFEYKDDVLGKWIFEHWDGHLDNHEKLILFAPLKDQLGMMWTNYRFVFCWYSASIWKGGTKLSLQKPRFVCQGELWHEQILFIEKKNRRCITFTCLPKVMDKRQPTNWSLSEELSLGMVQVHSIICQDEQVAKWWLKQLEENLFRSECRQSVVYHSTFHPNGHTFPNLSGDL
ncbi:hypothetical protein Gasu2_48670 [Galdieria sulphuraria]|nr:hypothetical protein Gasu2_48670 [Galdieria sulphuraria]